MLVAAMLVCLEHYAQVDFSARVFKPDGKPIVMFLEPSFMRVESEDTIRYLSDTTVIVHFEDIPIGSRCYFECHTIGTDVLYYSDIFTLDSNMYVDSMVMREQRVKHGYDDVFTWKELDSVVEQLPKDIDGYDTIWDNFLHDEVNCYRLARFYYNDWMNPFPSWRKWSSAADSAYKYCLYAYNNYPELYYLYYPLKQLACYLGVGFDRPQPQGPKGAKYLPQPEMPNSWWTDTAMNVFSLWEEYENDNEYRQDIFDKSREKTICCPPANDGTVRLQKLSPLDGIYTWRIQDGYLYYKIVSSRKSLLVKDDKVKLSQPVMDSLALLIDAFRSVPRTLDDHGLRSIDGPTYWLEYVVGGEYYHCTTTGYCVPKDLDDIIEFIERLKNLF